MPPRERKSVEALRLAIKGLIIQEIRVLQLEQARPPAFVLDEMDRSIQEAKRQVIKLVRLMPAKERSTLTKRLIRQSLDEEIDQAIEVRRNRCLRCVHMRFYDEGEVPHVNLPVTLGPPRTIGCDRIRSSGVLCRRFVETARAISLENYLQEVTLLYELREMFDQFEEIWEEYFLK